MLGIILGLILVNFKTIQLYPFFIIVKFVKSWIFQKTYLNNRLDGIYKTALTLKDSLENRLKREGYVEGIVEIIKHILKYSLCKIFRCNRLETYILRNLKRSHPLYIYIYNNKECRQT